MRLQTMTESLPPMKSEIDRLRQTYTVYIEISCLYSTHERMGFASISVDRILNKHITYTLSGRGLCLAVA
jgi:hypothetical protein